MTIERIHLDHLVQYAQHRGLVSSNLHTNEEEKQHATISGTYYLACFTTLFEEALDLHFGLHFGVFLNLKALGIIYDISLQTASIQQMVLVWVRYASISFPILKITAHETPQHYHITFTSTVSHDLQHQILDAILMFAYRELKLITNTSKISVHLPSLSTVEYQKWYDCPVHTGKSHRITFECPSTQIMNNTSQRKQIESLLPSFVAVYSTSKTDSSSFTNRVKSMMLHTYRLEFLSLSEIASLFCMTERTLQRKLKRENSSYRKILNTIKKELYVYLQADRALKRHEVSTILGYSSTSAFLHALQHWNME